MVGRRIGRDWPRLYRALPFVPRRGRETIDKDIRLIEDEFVGKRGKSIFVPILFIAKAVHARTNHCT